MEIKVSGLEAFIREVAAEKLQEEEIKQLTEDQKVLDASLPWFASIFKSLSKTSDGSLLLAFNVRAEEKADLESALKQLPDKEKLVVLLSRSVGDVKVEGLATVPFRDFNRLRPMSRLLGREIVNVPEAGGVPFVAGDGAFLMEDNRYLFNVAGEKKSAENFSPARRTFDLLSRALIGAVTAQVRRDYPFGETLKDRVAGELFKQYPNLMNPNVFRLDGRNIRVNQDLLWSVAQKLAQDIQTRAELRKSA